MTDPLREPVSLSDVDPAWPREYAHEEARIARALAPPAPTIEHIGSTSVPLRGKPILDIQVVVAQADITRAIAALEHLGYRHHGQGAVPGREYLTSRPTGGRPVNVHVFGAGSPLPAGNRSVRDYLRTHPDAARAYVACKERALEQGHTDLRSYSAAKEQRLAAIRAAADDWARRARK